MANLLWLNMEHRYLGSDKMDDPEFSGEKLKKTLQHLVWINKLLGNYKTVREALLKMASDLPKDRPLRLVDMGCGGGDLICHLSKQAKKSGFNLEFVGIDKNPNALVHARLRTKHNDQIQFLEADVRRSDFILPQCDFLISSHFIYHFDDLELKRFLSRNMPRVEEGLIFSELRRSVLSYRLFYFLGPLLFPGKHTVSDGLTAIRCAFTTAEVKEILHSHWPDSDVERVPFFRICITLTAKIKN